MRFAGAAIAVLGIALIGYTIYQRETEEPGSGKPSITVVSFGGAYQTAQREAYMAPFEIQAGARVKEAEYDGNFETIRERATAETGSWDVVGVESEPALHGKAAGLFYKVPDGLLTGLKLDPEAIREDAVGHILFATVIAFRSDGLGPTPVSWADFWDLEKFPGKRGLRNDPRGTLEMALLADGVAPENLYPLDLDRAFARLDAIRGQLVLWDTGEEPVKLLNDGTVVMSSIYNGRAWAASHDRSLPIGWSMDHGLLEMEYLAVPVNAPNPELAFDYIRFALQTPQQAALANRIPYVPTNLDAVPQIEGPIKSASPDVANSVAVDADWWAANRAAVAARWEEWVKRQ